MSEGTTEVSILPANETTGLPEVVIVNDQTLVKWKPKQTRERTQSAGPALATFAAAPAPRKRKRRRTVVGDAPASKTIAVSAEAAFRAAVGAVLVERGVLGARAILDEIEAAVVSSASITGR